MNEARMSRERRPLWQAALIGGAQGAIPMLVALAFLLGVPTQHGGTMASGAAGIFYYVLFLASIIPLVGGIVLGALMLRTRRSRTFTLLAVPGVLIALALAWAGATTVISALEEKHEALRGYDSEALTASATFPADAPSTGQ